MPFRGGGVLGQLGPRNHVLVKVGRIQMRGVEAWHNGNAVGRINEVTLRRARLVLGWVTCPGSTPGDGTSFRYVISHPGRLSLSSFRGR